jgi:folate-binding protein YgfZ
MALFFVENEMSVLRLTGADVPAYLQSQVSADLRIEGVQEALWLNRKGRIQALTTIGKETDGSYLILCDHLSAAELQTLVTANVIADDVEVQDVTGVWKAVTLWGDGLVDLPADAKVFPTRRWGVNAWMVLVPLGRPLPWMQGSLTELNSLRLRSGVPRVPIDAGVQDFPQESGLESLVSYHKGCYLGQEVMARIHAMGTLRRALRKVHADGPLVTSQPLLLGDKVVGETRSVQGSEGLAMVNVDLPEGAVLQCQGCPVSLGVLARY